MLKPSPMPVSNEDIASKIDELNAKLNQILSLMTPEPLYNSLATPETIMAQACEFFHISQEEFLARSRNLRRCDIRRMATWVAVMTVRNCSLHLLDKAWNRSSSCARNAYREACNLRLTDPGFRQELALFYQGVQRNLVCDASRTERPTPAIPTQKQPATERA